MWKGPGALLVVPCQWGIVYTMNKAKCNTVCWDKQLDVYAARVLFITTTLYGTKALGAKLNEVL